jgi:F-type H+-transporting ATPase subunit epsilon
MDTTEGKILLEIVTPYKKVLSKYVDEIRMPGAMGELGILYDHAPLLTSLHTGELAYKIGDVEESLYVSWGFAEILGDRVIVLAETAEIAHEIDITRARREKEMAEMRLKGYIDTDQEYLDTNTALKKATTRISIGSKQIK